MTKPDPDVPDPETPDPDPADARAPDMDADMEASGAHPTSDGATDDDAVWLDLVARLQGVGDGTDEAAPGWPDEHGPAGGETDSPAKAEQTAPAGPLQLPGRSVTLTRWVSLAPRPRNFPPRNGCGKPAGNPVPRAGTRDRTRLWARATTRPRTTTARFVPEEPPSLAGADPLTVLAWIGAVGGPVALVLSAMFWRSAPLLAILGMVVVFAASVVFLIMKLPGEKDEHDDGARV